MRNTEETWKENQDNSGSLLVDVRVRARCDSLTGDSTRICRWHYLLNKILISEWEKIRLYDSFIQLILNNVFITSTADSCSLFMAIKKLIFLPRYLKKKIIIWSWKWFFFKLNSFPRTSGLDINAYFQKLNLTVHSHSFFPLLSIFFKFIFTFSKCTKFIIY